MAGVIVPPLPDPSKIGVRRLVGDMRGPLTGGSPAV